MFYCGFIDDTATTNGCTNGTESSGKDMDAVSDDVIRKRKSRTVPKFLDFLPKDVTKYVPVHGLLYFQSKEQGFCECNLRNGVFVKIDMGYLKEAGFVMTSFFVDSVYEQIFLLLVKTVFNYEQQTVMKWRSGTKVVTDDESFSLYQLDEDEKVIDITGTEEFGIVHTSKERLWMIQNWRLRSSDWILKPVLWEKPIMQVSCGKEHVIVLTTDGCVLTMGKSSRGQLGTGSTSSCDSLTKVEVLEPLHFTKVVAGGWHSLALSDSGDIYGWGWNESGQIGSCLDDTNQENKVVTKENIPKLIFTPSLLDTPLEVSFSNIFAGTRHSVSLTIDGKVFTWGWNAYGQLGHGDEKERLLATPIGFLKQTNVKKIICGSWSTMFIVT